MNEREQLYCRKRRLCPLVCQHTSVRLSEVSTQNADCGSFINDGSTVNTNNDQQPVSLSQVKVYNLDENKHGPDDVLVMGTDGLWDVTTDREVADAVTAYLSCCDPSDPMR